jgi:hypothetical protein
VLLNLNKKQKIVLIAGMISLIILVATTPRYTPMEGGGRYYSEEGGQINLGEAFLRLIVVLLVTTGLIAVLKDSKKQ